MIGSIRIVMDVCFLTLYIFAIILDLCKPNDISLLHAVVHQTPEEELDLTMVIGGSDHLIKEIDSSTAIQEGIYNQYHVMLCEDKPF
jgi:hypothetical protein